MSENGKSNGNASSDKQEEKKTTSGEKQSFWTTLPGILTAVTGLVVAVTGLISALGDEGIIGSRLNEPTPFATVTPVDQDSTLSPAVEETPVVSTGMPTCNDFSTFDGKANSNAVVLAYTDNEFWVRYADLEDEVENTAGVKIYMFDTSAQSGQCLREWVRYLGADRSAHWPQESVGKGRKYSEVWINSATPPRTGELATWLELPDNILIAVADESNNPDYFQVYQCGQDIPREELVRVIYFHAATTEEALEGYVELYQSNGFVQRATVSCGN